ncbi:MAG: hypothetical protein ACQEP8_03270 [Chlamydiota bacterium]
MDVSEVRISIGLGDSPVNKTVPEVSGSSNTIHDRVVAAANSAIESSEQPSYGQVGSGVATYHISIPNLEEPTWWLDLETELRKLEGASLSQEALKELLYRAFQRNQEFPSINDNPFRKGYLWPHVILDYFKPCQQDWGSSQWQEAVVEALLQSVRSSNLQAARVAAEFPSLGIESRVMKMKIIGEAVGKGEWTARRVAHHIKKLELDSSQDRLQVARQCMGYGKNVADEVVDHLEDFDLDGPGMVEIIGDAIKFSTKVNTKHFENQQLKTYLESLLRSPDANQLDQNEALVLASFFGLAIKQELVANNEDVNLAIDKVTDYLKATEDEKPAAFITLFSAVVTEPSRVDKVQLKAVVKQLFRFSIDANIGREDKRTLLAAMQCVEQSSEFTKQQKLRASERAEHLRAILEGKPNMALGS